MERANLKPRTVLARELRQRSTDAEWKLWSILRNRQLGGYKVRRQVPIDRYFADFACLDARLIVELDGSQHEDRAEYDAARTSTLQGSAGACCGFTMARCSRVRSAWPIRSCWS